jgi:hypothetical protein
MVECIKRYIAHSANELALSALRNFGPNVFFCFDIFYETKTKFIWIYREEELDGSTVSALRRAIAEVKQRGSVIGWVTKIYYLKLLRASVGVMMMMMIVKCLNSSNV